MDTTKLKELLARASKLEVITTTINHYSKPLQSECTFIGDIKFTKAFVDVVSATDNEIVHIWVTEDRDGWMYRHQISHTDFIKCFAYEVLSKSLSTFVGVMFKHSNGYAKDNAESLKSVEAEVYNAHDDGQFFWKNMIAQESAVAEAKSKAEALANEIINAKSTSKSAQPFDDFGSGNPSV